MEPMTQTISLLAVLLFALLLCLRSFANWKSRARGRPLPPGPISLPIVGNFFNAPSFKPWITYRDLSTQHGDIVHVRVLGQSTVALNSAEVIDEFLDKRSAVTSGRKQTPLIELTGSDMNFGFHPYGPSWRRHRRLFWQHFTSRAVAQYTNIQRTMAHRFLVLLSREPMRQKEHIRYTFSAAMLKVLYDIDAADQNDQYIANIDAALEGVSQGLVPGKFFVESFPLLRHLPAWVPFAGFQKHLARWRAATLALKHEPFAVVKAAMDRGVYSRSVVAGHLTSLNRSDVQDRGSTLEEEEDVIKNVGAVALEGGSDTTFSTLQTILLAMSLHPTILKKAQAELDTVVGPHRLPDFSDREVLVYVNAIIKEGLRWFNVLPLCVPHCTTADNEFHGYFIPEGTVLLPNIWACMHDPKVYEDPDEFRPERFIKQGRLEPAVRDPSKFVFGFGRRICPGRHFADSSLFINVASVLHVFDISPPLDENGHPIRCTPQMTDGLLSYPEDARCSIKPRSAQAEALIMSHA